MKSSFRFITLVFITIVSISSSFSQEIAVTLDNGKKVILHEDHTWSYTEGYHYDFSTIKDNRIPNFLRDGIQADKATLVRAVEMYEQGWRYTMPRPKSNQARWGNYDGRTTWWYGYWYNEKNGKYSSTVPEKAGSGYYEGDYQNRKGEPRRGGSPGKPSKIMWLLSSGGGVKP